MEKQGQSSLLWKAMYGAAKPNAMKNIQKQLKNPGLLMSGLLGRAAIQNYVNPYLSQYDTDVNLDNQTINYNPNDKYSFSLGEEYGYPKLGMRIKY